MTSKQTFKQAIINKLVKGPTQRDYSVDKWTAAWLKTGDDSKEGFALFEAGLAFFKVFGDLRDILGTLYREHAPNVSNEELLKNYCAISNRDRSVASKHAMDLSNATSKNVFSMTIDTNVMSNELTVQEVMVGCVDAFQKAISTCADRIIKGENLVPGNDPMDPLDFIRHESFLAQLYQNYEDLWMALVWGDYTFSWVDKKNNVAEIEQQKTESEIAFKVCQMRKERFGSDVVTYIDKYLSLFANDNFVQVIGAGKQRKFKVSKISGSKEHEHTNAMFQISSQLAMNYFPNSMLESRSVSSKINVKEILDVFRIMSLIANSFMDKFPDDDSAFTPKKLQVFCPTLGVTELCIAISKALDIEFSKAQSILTFLTYQQPRDDLWAHPLLKTQNGKICLLASALVTPNLLRTIEHWLVKLEIELDQKGYHYEGNIIESLNELAGRNRLIVDFDKAVSKRFKLPGGEEEIDLLMRIGDVILLGEAKSIVTTDSPISYFNTQRTLKYAAEQALRKRKFVEANFNDIKSTLNWKFEVTEPLKIVPLVLNSNKMLVGFSIDNVPVCDEAILTAYFKGPEFPMFSAVARNKVEHYAWFNVYSDFLEFQNNLELYLKNPPQILDDIDSFISKKVTIPSIEEQFLSLTYSRLVPRDISHKERLEKKYTFKLNVVPDIEEKLAGIDVVI